MNDILNKEILKVLSRKLEDNFCFVYEYNRLDEAMEIVRLNTFLSQRLDVDYFKYGMCVVKDDKSTNYDYVITFENEKYQLWEINGEAFNIKCDILNGYYDIEQLSIISEKFKKGLDNIQISLYNDHVREFLENGSTKVGYLQSTKGGEKRGVLVYKAFNKFINKMFENNCLVLQEDIKHKNAYATNNGGFYNEVKYTFLNKKIDND